jgi:hypothetical protein
MHNLPLRKNKAKGVFVEKIAKRTIVACSFAQHFPAAAPFCTPFVDKIVCNAVDSP